MTTYETINVIMLIVSAISVIVSPLVAIFITRYNDDKKETIRRKSEVLTKLMGTRSLRLSIEHVSALNVVQLEFHDTPKVLTAYQNYITHLGTTFPSVEADIQRYLQHRSDLFMDLVHAMASSLGYDFDKRDLERLSYGPQAWYQEEENIRIVRSHLIDVLSNAKPLSVVIRPDISISPGFPPPPA